VRRARITPRALADLDAIADYTLAHWGEAQTTKYITELTHRFQWLAEHPHAGRTRDEVAKGYHSYPHGAHVIFYVVEAEQIAIIGVPHGSMDIEAYFNVDQP
jgi:toxin ParE1/3/4